MKLIIYTDTDGVRYVDSQVKEHLKTAHIHQIGDDRPIDDEWVDYKLILGDGGLLEFRNIKHRPQKL